MNTPSSNRYKNHRFPVEIISYAVWLYFRFCLSYRDVEELLFARGIIVTYETIRQWCRTFGQDYANQLRRRRPRPGDKWHMETSRAQLKTTMRMDVLHCTTVPGVLKELTVFAIVDTLVRMVMCPSAKLQHTGVERISFLDALRWLGAPSTGIPLGALIVNAIRPHRVEPRVKKRRPKSVPLMIKPRQALRQQLVQQEVGG
jgi:hypothetical protein